MRSAHSLACVPARRRALVDLPQHQQLGAVQMPDPRHAGEGPLRRLVHRGQVMQVKEVGLARARAARAWRAPGLHLVLVRMVVEPREHPVGGAGAVLERGVERRVGGHRVGRLRAPRRSRARARRDRRRRWRAFDGAPGRPKRPARQRGAPSPSPAASGPGSAPPGSSRRAGRTSGPSARAARLDRIRESDDRRHAAAVHRPGRAGHVRRALGAEERRSPRRSPPSLPMRPSGGLACVEASTSSRVEPVRSAIWSAMPPSPVHSPLSTGPGATAFTSTPRAAQVSANTRLSESSRGLRHRIGGVRERGPLPRRGAHVHDPALRRPRPSPAPAPPSAASAPSRADPTAPATPRP